MIVTGASDNRMSSSHSASLASSRGGSIMPTNPAKIRLDSSYLFPGVSECSRSASASFCQRVRLVVSGAHGCDISIAKNAALSRAIMRSSLVAMTFTRQGLFEWLIRRALAAFADSSKTIPR